MGVEVVDDDTPIALPEMEVYNEEWSSMVKMKNEKKDKILRGKYTGVQYSTHDRVESVERRNTSVQYSTHDRVERVESTYLF